MRILGSCVLFWLLTGYVSANTIITTVGSDVTLHCNYDAKYYGRLFVCWGRGDIPNSGCANEVIRSDGTKVTGRLSERYHLIGDLGEGDVSLTITQVQEGDSGVYGCRVEIPGWFNDHKHQTTLRVNPGRPLPLKVETREVKERTLTVRWTAPFDGGRPITTYIIEIKNKYASWDTAIRTEVTQPQLTQVTLVDLRPYKTYNLRMFAANSVGTSETSNVLTITTKEGVPEGPPFDVQLQALSSDSISVTWKPPKTDLRNGVLRSYTISYREDEGNQFKRWQHVSVTATREVESFTLTNLKPSTWYSVRLQAKTSAGTGPASDSPRCSTLDEVPETTAASSTVTSSSSSSAAAAAATTRTHHTSLTPVHTALTAQMVPTSTAWEETTSTLTLVPPDPPVIELKEVKDNAISLFWTPGFEGDSPTTGYFLEYKAANASWDYTESVVDFSPNETDATIIEINPSTYNIRMFAKSSVGTSKASNVLTVTTGGTDRERENLIPTFPNDSESVMTAENTQGVPTAAIVVPIVVVPLIGTVMLLILRRMKHRNGHLNVWMSRTALRYKGSDSLQEL
ncbi:cell adhesion molecule DSCAML1 isoform X1 [Nothobranchius furzeri]|uniref:Transcript variant X1 n=1 Tax=Nothobranchius furzeri TaxID=105023 RepID=A0A1A8ANK9_NOTFU|nr:transcript variant X1 [Nothobranchius furzeri]